MPIANLVEVPRDSLSHEALRGVIEEFVTRAGTDYGTQEGTIEEKIADVERQLERGEAIIVCDIDGGTTTIVPRHRAIVSTAQGGPAELRQHRASGEAAWTAPIV